MHFDDTNKQWISGSSGIMKFGDKLKEEVIRQGKDTIPAGTVMVFGSNHYLMFQTLQELVLSSCKNNTLVYYEKGSVLFNKGVLFHVIPTLRFRDCRFPTEVELRRYEREVTV